MWDLESTNICTDMGSPKGVQQNTPSEVIKLFTLRCSLLVDDKDKLEKKRPSSATRSSSDSAVRTFYYGGSPSSSFKNFTGCISYAYINRYSTSEETRRH